MHSVFSRKTYDHFDRLQKNSNYYVFQVIIPLKQIQLILTTKSQNFKREKAEVRQEVK